MVRARRNCSEVVHPVHAGDARHLWHVINSIRSLLRDKDRHLHTAHWKRRRSVTMHAVNPSSQICCITDVQKEDRGDQQQKRFHILWTGRGGRRRPWSARGCLITGSKVRVRRRRRQWFRKFFDNNLVEIHSPMLHVRPVPIPRLLQVDRLIAEFGNRKVQNLFRDGFTL